MAIPEIVTERVRLRRLQVSDAPDIFAYGQDELVAKSGLWELYESFDQCQRHVERLVADEDLMWWALEHRAGWRVRGECGTTGGFGASGLISTFMRRFGLASSISL
jgi:RimJ/RimL family protein N-acetyltransferase